LTEPILDLVNLVVSDMGASVAFYRRLGLTVPDTDDTWQGHHRNAEVSGGGSLHLDSEVFARHWDRGWHAPRAIIGFSLERRERVDALYAELTEAGYAGQQEPYDAFWGARYAVVEDPDGNPVGLMSPVDPARRSDPGFP
jgi:uncharacterized glyoxalase superfamily protein PhnB